LFALKLAEWQILKKQKGYTPILLLDDVFEKLDEKRMYQLLHWVCSESDGQVFITDTHAQRLKEQLTQTNISFQLIEIK
jgi:DNA replication and repair protein RecF